MAIVTVLMAGAVAVTGSDAGEKLHVAPTGNPMQLNDTVPLNPFAGATLTVACAELPADTVPPPEPTVNPKVGVAPAVVTLPIFPNRP